MRKRDIRKWRKVNIRVWNFFEADVVGNGASISYNTSLNILWKRRVGIYILFPATLWLRITLRTLNSPPLWASSAPSLSSKGFRKKQRKAKLAFKTVLWWCESEFAQNCLTWCGWHQMRTNGMWQHTEALTIVYPFLLVAHIKTTVTNFSN